MRCNQKEPLEDQTIAKAVSVSDSEQDHEYCHWDYSIHDIGCNFSSRKESH